MIITFAMIAVLNNEIQVRDVFKTTDHYINDAWQDCKDERLTMMDQCMIVLRRDSKTLTLTNLETGYQLVVKTSKDIK